MAVVLVWKDATEDSLVGSVAQALEWRKAGEEGTIVITEAALAGLAGRGLTWSAALKDRPSRMTLLRQARELGLYISSSIKNDEPPEFAEPGLFLIRPDRTLYCASIQTMPFARPAFSDVLRAVSFVIEKDYPARGAA